MHIERRQRKIPPLTTAALPDLIFTVLFFFMIVTHMRKQEVKVEYELPQGTELTSMEQHDNTLFIYVGKSAAADALSGYQVGNKKVSQQELSYAVANEVSRLRASTYEPLTAVVSADVHTSMGDITDIKVMLKNNGVEKIRYTAVSGYNQGASR